MSPAGLSADAPRPKRALWTTGPVPLVALALLVPGHMYGWALEWVWLGLQLFFGTLALVGGGRRITNTAGVPALVWACVFAAVTLSGCLSAFYGNAVVGLPLADGDIIDLVRLLLFIPLTFHMGSLLERRHVNSVVRLLKISVLLNIGCSAILLLDIHPFVDLVLGVYKDAKVQYAINHIRIGIPFANPNFAALLFSLMLAIFLFYRRSVFFASLTVAAILITGSRSGYLAIAPLLLLAYLLAILRAATSPKALILVIALHVFALIALNSVSELFGGFSRINELSLALQGGDLGQVNTANIRFELIENARKYIEASPVLGVGAGRALGLDVVDSQVFSWPLNYGIPMAFILYGLFLAPMGVIVYRAKEPVHRFAAIATALSFFLMLGTGDFMKNFRLFYLVLVMMHVMYLIATPLGSEHAEATLRFRP
ncbi:O-antigen ligase family protein [Roseateles sp.]|uniref:O-antigen ligase family protein n=1 Tax=Roseateles sp. TaxID=1971397 RepID=UPI002DFF46AC|nr:O-antigen ligase family protein [Roseateles sp.]